MSPFTLKFMLGAPSEDLPGQWLDGTVEFGAESFTLTADICCRISADEFSMYRIHEQLDQPFTAELFLGILSLIAEDEFLPSAPGFELFCSGDGAAPTGEIARILEPEVRAGASPALVPASVAESLRQQMRRVSAMRQLQRGMMHITG